MSGAGSGWYSLLLARSLARSLMVVWVAFGHRLMRCPDEKVWSFGAFDFLLRYARTLNESSAWSAGLEEDYISVSAGQQGWFSCKRQ